MKFRILFVDDDTDMHVLLRRAADRCGLFSEVVFAPGADEALARLQGFKPPQHPDLIVTDLKMCARGGIQLLEELKGDAGTRHLPVVVLTSSCREDDRRRSLAAGACACYEKPASLAGLEKILRDALVRCHLL